MTKSGSCVLLAAIATLGCAGVVQADRGEGAATARQGVIRCGGNNFLRLSGTEIHFTSYVFRNFDSTNPIVFERMRLFDATGALLFDSAFSGLPPSQEGLIGPANNVLFPNQTTQFDSSTIVPFLPQTNRPIQLELAWSSDRAALSLDAITVRISRQRDPATGAVQTERGRHAVECRSIFLK